MRTRDVFFAVLAGLTLAVLSIPYGFETAYWAESSAAWVAYVLLGTGAAIIALYLFLTSQRHILSRDDEGGDGDD